jgi:hypothetical protein
VSLPAWRVGGAGTDWQVAMLFGADAVNAVKAFVSVTQPQGWR